MNPPTIERLAVHDVTLFTRSIGSGPQVIVLHGGPGAHHDYLLPQFDALATRRCLRYYDQRGGGQSPVDRDTQVGWREHVADLDALITHWAAAPATLLGYSWGALLAMLYAIEHPERVARLALVSPAAASAAGRAESDRRFAERMQSEKVRGARRTVQASGLRERDPEAYRKRIFELAVAGYFRDAEQARGLTPFRITGRTQEAVWKSLGSFDLRPQLGRLHVPVLVAHGRHDPIPLETAEETARLLNAKFVIFEHSGHVPYVEEFDRFVGVLDEFLPRS